MTFMYCTLLQHVLSSDNIQENRASTEVFKRQHYKIECHSLPN